jgi:hypothetical protein
VSHNCKVCGKRTDGNVAIAAKDILNFRLTDAESFGDVVMVEIFRRRCQPENRQGLVSES